MIARVARTALLLLAFTSPVAAQRPNARSQALGAGGQDTAGRAQLESDIRRGFARIVRQRVGLNDEQMTRLGPVAMRYEQERRQLQMAERNARLSLRATLRDEQSADPKQVERSLQVLVDVQKRRVQLLEAEQRDLAAIMSPVQRAKFMALQEQVRRRLEQMRQRRMQLFEGELPGPRSSPMPRPPR